MRINEGMFRRGADVRKVRRPATRYEYELDERYLRVMGMKTGGVDADKINGHLFHVEVTAPHEGVLRLSIRTRLGSAAPPNTFPELNLQSLPLESGADDEAVWCRNGELLVRFRDPWRYEFETSDGSILTRSRDTGLAEAIAHDGETWLTDALDLGPGGLVYGLGERFGSFVRNGQKVVIRQFDGATESDYSYKNVPFYMTNEGYGVFVNTTAPVEFEVATAEVNAVRFAAPGCSLDYFIVYGPTPKQILERYTAITGRPPAIPSWSFGLWLTTSFTTDYNEKIITEQIEGMEERGIPLSVFHFDCFWMKERRWIDFTWDRDAFPDPEGMIKRLKSKGLRICVWINPYVSEISSLFREGLERGYFLKEADGSVWQGTYWQPGFAVIDFTNPEACEWYAGHLERLMDMGVDTFKTDFGEDIPEDVTYYDGSDGRAMRNYYTRLYNELVFRLIERRLGSGEAIVFARSGTAGSQRFPVHWGGDSRAEPASMAGQLRGGLSLSLSGFAFWSHDIGGFFGKPSPGLYKRWVAFGLLSSHSRLHGDESYRVPWEYDEEAVDVLRSFTKARATLVPYLERLAEEATRTGCPVMRPMMLEFPDDPACATIDSQFMLGPDLLVAPVFDPAPRARVSYYLPAGEWRDWWSGDRVTGGRWIRETRGYFDPPVFVRKGANLNG